MRVAGPDDADAVAVIQVRAWQERYADVLPPDALPADAAGAAEVWRAAMTRPPDARHRVLIALDRARACGFAVTGPATDPDCDPIVDGELTELVVDPDSRGVGHGSRLLQAAADTMVADGFGRAVCWLLSTEDAARRFLVDAGWDADGAYRQLDLRGDSTTVVNQVRLHCRLGPDH